MLILGTMLMLSVVATPRAHASEADIEFYIDPALNQYPSSTTLHTKFNVTVMWKDVGTPVTEAFAWQITMNYNLTLLNCTRGWQPVWDGDYVFYGMSTVRPTASLAGGQAQIMDSLYSGSGSGALKKLAILEFDIIYLPPEGIQASSALNINNADSFWSPDGTTWNNPTLTDGTYTIPELSLAIIFLALFATSTSALVLHKKR